MELLLGNLNLLVKQFLALVPFPALRTLRVPFLPTTAYFTAERFIKQAATEVLLKGLSAFEFIAKLFVPVVLKFIITTIGRSNALEVMRLESICIVGESLVRSQEKANNRKQRYRLASNFSDHVQHRVL